MTCPINFIAGNKHRLRCLVGSFASSFSSPVAASAQVTTMDGGKRGMCVCFCCDWGGSLKSPFGCLLGTRLVLLWRDSCLDSSLHRVLLPGCWGSRQRWFSLPASGLVLGSAGQFLHLFPSPMGLL